MNEKFLISNFKRIIKYSNSCLLQVDLNIIEESGRKYVQWNCKIELSKQDEGRTLKIFVKQRE